MRTSCKCVSEQRRGPAGGARAGSSGRENENSEAWFDVSRFECVRELVTLPGGGVVVIVFGGRIRLAVDVDGGRCCESRRCRCGAGRVVVCGDPTL